MVRVGSVVPVARGLDAVFDDELCRGGNVTRLCFQKIFRVQATGAGTLNSGGWTRRFDDQKLGIHKVKSEHPEHPVSAENRVARQRS